MVHYRHHPLCGREVRVVRRCPQISADSLLVVLPDGSPCGLPEWMLDPIACATLTDADQPLCAVVALQALRALIDAQPLASSLADPGDSLQKEDPCNASIAARDVGSAAPTELGPKPLVGPAARK